jgi:hypothetical protein
MTETVLNTKTGMGAAIGGLIGFICAGPPGAAIGALVGGGVAHASTGNGKGVMTAKRQLIYTHALESIKSPKDLKTLADAFSGEGLEVEAGMLRKRAALRELPSDVKEQRRAFFRRGMSSDNPDTIDRVASAFEGEGALDAAKALHDHAEAVRAAHMAGASTKPMAEKSQTDFANKLAKAIMNFGPDSAQAKSAAKNLVAARGKHPTDALITEVIRLALGALEVPAPAAVRNEPVEIDGRDPGAAEGDVAVEGDVGGEPPAEAPEPRAEEAPEASTETAVAEAGQTVVAGENEDKGAPEPTVVGPPAQKVEPPAEVEAAAQANA